MKLKQVQSLFKIKRVKWNRPNIVGLENYFFRIVKLVGKKEYIYGFKFISKYHTFWKVGKKKQYLNATTLTVISIFFYLIFPLLFLFVYIRAYFIEGYRFVRDSRKETPIFTYGNILIIIILTILLILK